MDVIFEVSIPQGTINTPSVLYRFIRLLPFPFRKVQLIRDPAFPQQLVHIVSIPQGTINTT